MADQATNDLVRRLKAGDESAVATLSNEYGSRIYQLAFRYMKNGEDAEEVTQDVLLKVFRKIDAFRGDAALSSWIYRITFNTAMSRLRHSKFRHPAEVQVTDWVNEDGERRGSALGDVADWSSMADDEVLRAQMRKRLVSAHGELPPIYRTPVVLRDIQGLSTEEASVVLGIKTQTLKSRLHRGRLILREHLAEFADGLTLRRAA